MQTLFTSDRMIVKGEIKNYNIIGNDSSFKEEQINCIGLEFIFQVNGRLTQFSYSFPISEIELQGLTLTNWYEWYPVAELFFSMGYNFGDNPFAQNPMMMKKWIHQCNGTKSE